MTKKKSLLEKYKVPLHHLEFDYVKKCENISELEKILKILRSGEEGCYPELLQRTEERLRSLCPDSKILMTCKPVMTKSHLKCEEWESIQKEIMDWKEDVDKTDSILSKSKDLGECVKVYPEVRRPTKRCDKELKENAEKEKRISSTDYNQWDKFDADKECLKLDLEEEKRSEERKRQELAQKKKLEAEAKLSLEEKEIETIAETAESLSQEERKVVARKEKDLGNEFYRRNLFNDALKHYTRSIFLHSTAVAYNNRAATYLKQCKFTKALDDLNIVLDLEPDNVKAHFRRALALQHKNEFRKALDDILFVLRHEPNHVIAKHIADELRENCSKLPKIHRLRIRDEKDPNKVAYVEVTEEEFQKKYKDKKDYVEVNDFNLPKIMCNCNGKYTNDPLINSNDPIRYQHIRARYGARANERIAEMERASRMLRGSGTKTNNPVKFQSYAREQQYEAKPIVQEVDTDEDNKTAANAGGRRRLEIVELEKIEEEEVASKIQGTHLNNALKGDNKMTSNSSANVSTCLVTDRRKYKSAPKIYFGNYEEGTEENHCREVAGAQPLTDDNNQVAITKEEKMNLNINLKESTELEAAGGAGLIIDEGMQVDDYLTDFVSTEQQPALSPRAYEESSSSGPPSDDELLDEISADVHCAGEGSSVNELDQLAERMFPDELLRKCDCGKGFLLRPTQFEHKWQSFNSSPNPLLERSRLIRLICPHRLSSVISSTLNEEVLSGFIDCLSQCFDTVTEGDKVRSYLESIANLQRFKIIYCFLSENSKHSVSTLLKKLASISPELEKAYS